jgi:predicted O-methyltransferase YrrM
MDLKKFVPEKNIGSVLLDDARLLQGLMKALNPLIVVEIGTFIGTSTIVMAEALKEIGNEGKIFTVDHDKLDVEIKLAEHGVGDMVVLHYMDSYDFAKEMVEKLPYIDFVFYDGEATKEQYLRHFEMLKKKMQPGSIYAVHDRYTRATAHAAFLEMIPNQKVTIPTEKGLTLIQV